MCRILAVKSESLFECAPHLQALARIAEECPVYQGHGWGCAWLDEAGEWRRYHDIRPIWEDDWPGPGATRLLIAHARNACGEDSIAVENNMPFFDGKRVFAFNGELRGVRIREQGRIGAERIFNYIKRFDGDDQYAAFTKALRIIESRTRYVRAMNVVLSDGAELHVSTAFGEDPDYFTLHMRESSDGVIVCSQPYLDQAGWSAIPNHTSRTFR